MDNIIEKILDFFLNLKLMQNLKEKSNSKIITTLYDKPFMIHIIKYIIFGLITTIACIGLFAFLIKCTALGDTDTGENLANLISIIFALILAYILNRQFVFESKEKNIAKEFLKFVFARLLSMGFDMLTFFILATLLKWDEILVKIIIQVGVTILNYIFSKLFVFKNSSFGDTHQKKNFEER